MNRNENTQVWITVHAHEQYCKRVEETELDMLQYDCSEQLKAGDYGYKGKGFIHLSGVWWTYETHDELGIFFTTCYGKSNIHMPKAVAWAHRHHDRINLSGNVI